MKIITFEDIKNLNIDPVTCYQWVSEMIENKKKAILPPKISLSSRDGMFMNTMPLMMNIKERIKDMKIYNQVSMHTASIIYQSSLVECTPISIMVLS